MGNQDINELFNSSTGVRKTCLLDRANDYRQSVGTWRYKQPDIHWSLAKVHNPPNLMPNFATDPRHDNILPGFCMETALKTESVPTLLDTDVPRYFAPSAAPRCWIGIKLLLDESSGDWDCQQLIVSCNSRE